VLDWSGSDGVPVALDQELLIRFDAELRLPVRPSSVVVEDERGRTRGPFELEVQGSLLRLRPRLAKRPDLLDGALPPDRSLRVRLAGVPSLQALAAEDGALLRGGVTLELRTLGSGEAAALAGVPQASGVVHLLDLADGGVLRFSSRPGHPARVRLSAGLDPRTLGEAPHIRSEESDGGASVLPVAVELVENEPEEAIVELQLDDWIGRGTLEWPASWQAIGGYPIAEPHRRVRIWRGL
jgi:hypothetical protein